MSAPSFNPHTPLTAPSCAAAAYDEPMSTPTSPAPSWIRHAICWQVYPLGFCGAPQRREDLTGESYGDADGEKDRKSTRLNSSHVAISYAVFCLKKKKTTTSYTVYTWLC